MFTDLRNLIPHAIHKYNLERTTHVAFTCLKYRKIAKKIWGEEVLKKAKPLYVKNNILYVGVINSGWANTVFQKKIELLRAINEGAEKKVEEIKTVVES